MIRREYKIGLNKEELEAGGYTLIGNLATIRSENGMINGKMLTSDKSVINTAIEKANSLEFEYDALAINFIEHDKSLLIKALKKVA